MDSLEKEQLFDSITMSLLLGHSNTARYVFNDSLRLAREKVIEDCIELALKNNAYYLARDIEKIKE